MAIEVHTHVLAKQPSDPWSGTVGIQACGDVMVMIGQHGREVIPAYLWGKGDSHFFSCIIITEN